MSGFIKKISMCMILTVLLSSAAFMGAEAEEAIIFDYTGTNFTQNGSWTKDGSIGYNLIDALCANGGDNASASWKIGGGTSAGTIFRLYFWKTLSEDASANVTVAYSSETQEFAKKLALNRGASGWEELGIVSLSGAGATLTVTSEHGKVYVSAVRAVPLDTDYLSLVSVLKSSPDSIILQTDNKKAFVGSVLSTVPDVPPMVVDGSTIVPLRFVAEAMGASVDWDSEKNAAIISVNNRTVVFFAGSEIYTVDGEEKSMGQPAGEYEGRLMLPLRIMAEAAGKEVFWDSSGLIVIADKVNLDSSRDRNTISGLIKILNREE